MSDYTLNCKVSDDTAHILSNVKAGSFITAGLSLAVAGVCTYLLTIDIVENPQNKKGD